MSDVNDVLNIVLAELDSNNKNINTFINLNEIEQNNCGSLIYSLVNFINKEYNYAVKTFYPVSIFEDTILFFGEISESDLRLLCPMLKITSIITETKSINVVGLDSNLFSEVFVSEIKVGNSKLGVNGSVLDILFSFLCQKIGLMSSDQFNNKAEFSIFLKKWVEYQQRYIICNRVIAA